MAWVSDQLVEKMTSVGGHQEDKLPCVRGRKNAMWGEGRSLVSVEDNGVSGGHWCSAAGEKGTDTLEGGALVLGNMGVFVLVETLVPLGTLVFTGNRGGSDALWSEGN